MPGGMPALTLNCANTSARVLLVPVMIMVSFWLPPVSPALGRTVNVAVPPGGKSLRLDSVPMSNLVAVGWRSRTGLVPVLVTVTVCEFGGVMYPASSIPNGVRDDALITNVSAAITVTVALTVSDMP
jgi:hypothetical protein